MRTALLAALLLVSFFFGCLANGLRKESVTIGTARIDAWVSDTQASRNQGLMNVQRIGENEGMIFVYDRPGMYRFWMKNTLIPLDLIFVSDNLTVISIQHMRPCVQDLCLLYEPPSEIMYAIEVNDGFTEINNVMVGEQISIG